MVEYKDRLAEAMRDAKIDITALASDMKISYQAVRKVLNGGRFGTENHLKAAKLLGVSSEWLATGKGSKRPGEQPTDRPEIGRRKGDFVKAVTPDEQALLDELLDLFRELFPSDRKVKLEELRALAKIRAAERKDLFEEAGVHRIMERAANASRRSTETSSTAPRHRHPAVNEAEPELPHIPPAFPPDEPE